MISSESIVLTRWIKRVGVDEFGFLDHSESPHHIIDYVDVHSAPYLDKVLPFCTQVFVESPTAGKVYTYFRPTSMAVEFLLNCKNELAKEKDKLEKIERRDAKSNGLQRQKWKSEYFSRAGVTAMEFLRRCI